MSDTAVSPVAPEASPSPKGLKLLFVLGGALLAALLLAFTIGYAIVSSQRTPELAASAFLDAVVQGDSVAALGQMSGVSNAPELLLAPEVFEAATDRITDYAVLETTTEGDQARVRVEVTQGGETSEQEIVLVRAGRDLGLFDVWRVSGEILPRVEVSYGRPEGMGLAIGGVEVEASGDALSFQLPALPGTYVFEPTGDTEWFTAEPVTITLGFDGQTHPVALPVALTESGAAAAQSAIDARLDGCIAQAALRPEPNCGFGVVDDGASYTNIRWSLVTRPTVSFGDYQANRGWPVTAASSGSMRMNADFTLGSESGTADALVENFEQSGAITGFDDGAVFESVIYE